MSRGETGRFLQPEPMGLFQPNLYSYGANNPIAFSDPSGLSAGRTNIFGPPDFLGFDQSLGPVQPPSVSALPGFVGQFGVLTGVSEFFDARVFGFESLAEQARLAGDADAFFGARASANRNRLAGFAFDAVSDPLNLALGAATFGGSLLARSAFPAVIDGAEAGVLARGGVPASRALIRRDFAMLAPDGGRLGGFSTRETLQPGSLIDRFGPNRGRFVSPAGTPFSARGLPPESANEQFVTLRVLQALDVEASIAAPAFGGGLGVQFRLPASVQELLDAGVLSVK